MRLFCVLLLITSLMYSCAEDDKSNDEALKFAINTNPKSKGLSSYVLPGSTNLNQIPQDPKNPLSADLVKLGQQLFYETAFSTGGEFDWLSQSYSCATCHHVEGGFQAGMRQGIGEGGIGFGVAGEGRRVDFDVMLSKIDVQPIRTPSAMNGAYQTNMLWNGQFGATDLNAGTESVWPTEGPIAVNRLGYEGMETQAIAGIAVHRMKFSQEEIVENGYQEMFDQALSRLPENRRYSAEGAGLAIAAFERTILSSQAPFQMWLRGNDLAMTEAQKAGAILFFTKGECYNCHNGPSLASMDFYATGMGDFDNGHDVLNFKADDPSTLGRASFTKRDEDNYKFKVPQLYNLKDSPFYGHGGTFTSVRDVITYKNNATPENSDATSQLSHYFVPLELSGEEIDQLTDFIENGLYDPNLARYEPSSVLSNSCIPNNDYLSKEDLGCQ